MSNIERSEGRHRDWPQLESTTLAALTAGTGNDPATESVIMVIPDITSRFAPTGKGQGITASVPLNRTVIGQVLFNGSAAAATSGNATNYADLRVNVWRAGIFQGTIAYYSLKVATTAGTAVAAAALGSAFTITPASMTGIVAGMFLGVGTPGAAGFEIVCVQSVTSTTLTTIFANTHASSDTLASVFVPYQPTVFVNAIGVISTTSATTITAGSMAVTPANIYGFHVGDLVTVKGGTGATEQVVITSITATTFTATYVNGHSGAYTLSTAGPATSTSTGSGYQPFVLVPGDVVTVTRLSNNATGIATPAGLVELELLPAGINA